MPLLITCGGKDVLVPHDVQSEPFARSLLELGKPVTYLYYPDEPHDFRQNSNWISFWAIGERFVSKHLGGRYEPYGDDLDSGSLDVKFGAGQIPKLVEAVKDKVSTKSPG
jgi:acetyl esterase/lipase